MLLCYIIQYLINVQSTVFSIMFYLEVFMFSDRPFNSYCLRPDPGGWVTFTGPEWVCSKYHCPIYDAERAQYTKPGRHG